MLPCCLTSPLLRKAKWNEIMFWCCWTCFDGVAAELGSRSCFQRAKRDPLPLHHMWAFQKQTVQQRQQGREWTCVKGDEFWRNARDNLLGMFFCAHGGLQNDCLMWFFPHKNSQSVTCHLLSAAYCSSSARPETTSHNKQQHEYVWFCRHPSHNTEQDTNMSKKPEWGWHFTGPLWHFQLKRDIQGEKYEGQNVCLQLFVRNYWPFDYTVLVEKTGWISHTFEDMLWVGQVSQGCSENLYEFFFCSKMLVTKQFMVPIDFHMKNLWNVKYSHKVLWKNVLSFQMFYSKISCGVTIQQQYIFLTYLSLFKIIFSQ